MRSESAKDESPSRPRCAQSHAAPLGLAPIPATFASRSATSTPPHFAKGHCLHATRAAGAETIAQPVADAACDEVVSQKPYPKRRALRESRIALADGEFNDHRRALAIVKINRESLCSSGIRALSYLGALERRAGLTRPRLCYVSVSTSSVSGYRTSLRSSSPAPRSLSERRPGPHRVRRSDRRIPFA